MMKRFLLSWSTEAADRSCQNRTLQWTWYLKEKTDFHVATQAHLSPSRITILRPLSCKTVAFELLDCLYLQYLDLLSLATQHRLCDLQHIPYKATKNVVKLEAKHRFQHPSIPKRRNVRHNSQRYSRSK
ncbi:hypothetical protein VTL71DRAFT_12583 [Oculimacula yallundae]|uniref:Uncharacterized protein n=1 Tax=Oculimacula yallundae TaxID=86028 RepID=A0ABR4CPR7_9HELO